MPELPEVETVLRTLEHQIQGRRILDVDVRYPKMIENDVEQFKAKLKNQTSIHSCVVVNIYYLA